MKNTLIPLDMIFIRADGTIAQIAANAVPLSLDADTVGRAGRGGPRDRGGRAAELGISDGDKVDGRADDPASP